MVPCALFVSAQQPFKDPNLPIEQRIDNAISLMTLSEKIDLLNSGPVSIPSLGFTKPGNVEALHGVSFGGPANWSTPSIPNTQFQQSYGFGETWDPEAVQQAASVIGDEIRFIFHKMNVGGLIAFSPNVDLGRDPRWGRTEECYGEDPFMCGTMGTAYVKGMQGNDPKYIKVAPTLKHFFANSNEDNRYSSNSVFDQRLFHEYYSVPFRMTFMDGKAHSTMTAYNAYNGIPCHVQPVVQEYAVKKWGLDGIIMTDGGGFVNLVNTHHYYSSLAQAAAACTKITGTNFYNDDYKTAMQNALSQNLMKESDIDLVLRGLFRTIIRLGVLDPSSSVPFTNVGTQNPWDKAETHALARTLMQKSVVLLKNSNNILPLNKTAIKSIAVIGEKANEVLLDWYSGMPIYRVTPLDGIKAKAGTGITVTYASSGSAAITNASNADVAIVCVGNNPTCNAGWGSCPLSCEGKEGIDRHDLNLDATQENLVKDVYNANKKTILVLISSFPYAITWEQQNVPGIVHITHNSQELGNGLADVLFGDYNPAGRLTQTWPTSLTQLPTMMDYNIRNGRTYMYFKDTPLYPFGYGLSYTTFEYSNLQTSADILGTGGEITVSVDVKNTGDRDGEEVAQMYVRHVDSKVSRPIMELKGFKRVAIPKGESTTVSIPLKQSALAYWDSTKNDFAVEEDNVELQIGVSSADIKLKKTIGIVNQTLGVSPDDFGRNRPVKNGRVVSSMRFERQNASRGIGIKLLAVADLDMQLCDLKGACVARIRAKNLSEGYHYIPITRKKLGTALYILSGMIGGKRYSTVVVTQ
jgi:beta-glucosidase